MSVKYSFKQITVIVGECTGEGENKNFLQSESSLQVKSIWRQIQDKSNSEEIRTLLERKSLKLTKKMRRKFENDVKSKIKIIGIIKRKQSSIIYHLISKKPTGGLGGGSEL